MWVGEGQGRPSSKVGLHFAWGHVKRSYKVLNLTDVNKVVLERVGALQLRNWLQVDTDCICIKG